MMGGLCQQSSPMSLQMRIKMPNARSAGGGKVISPSKEIGPGHLLPCDFIGFSSPRHTQYAHKIINQCPKSCSHEKLTPFTDNS